MPAAMGIRGAPKRAYDPIRNIVYLNEEAVIGREEDEVRAIMRHVENMPIVTVP